MSAQWKVRADTTYDYAQDCYMHTLQVVSAGTFMKSIAVEDNLFAIIKGLRDMADMLEAGLREGST